MKRMSFAAAFALAACANGESVPSVRPMALLDACGSRTLAEAGNGWAAGKGIVPDCPVAAEDVPADPAPPAQTWAWETGDGDPPPRPATPGAPGVPPTEEPSVDPIDPGGPAESGTPTDPGTPTDSGTPSNPGTPTDPGTSTDPGKPGKDPARPSKPGKGKGSHGSY